MDRLIRNGLIFGNLIRVDSPALVARYNRALEALTGKRTALDEFHVDIAGYSYEVGEELGDHSYLAPTGVNRMFIILSTAQKTAPLLNAQFSTSRDILRRFIEENETQLFALTAKDAVTGELDNAIYDVSAPARLFDIRRIRVRADTTRSHVAHARDLTAKIEAFRAAEDGWQDEGLIDEMIALARTTGDVTRNPVDLGEPVFEQPTFWTAHFGGLYLFRTGAAPAAIAVRDKESLGPLPIDLVLDLDDRNGIAAWLERAGMVEPVIRARGVDGAAILRQKMDFILVHAAALAGHAIEGFTRRDLHRLAQRLGPALPQEFRDLAALVRWAEGGGDWPRITSADASYFYTLRARPDHPDRDLVNQLLAELSPLDARQLFICHKAAFYAAYRGWPEVARAYVADFLHRDYVANKAGAREALFGGGTETAPSPWEATKDIVDLVGPWGALRRT